MSTRAPDPSAGADGAAVRGRATRAVRLWRGVLGALGSAAIAYGAVGLSDEPAYVDKWGVGRWLLGGLLIHDVLFAAAVFGVGRLVMRAGGPRGPAPWVRRSVLGGLAVGTAASLIALPALVRPWPPPNPSVLPLDYGRNLALIWAAVAAATAAVIAVRAGMSRRR